jgi:hypothetical protein
MTNSPGILWYAVNSLFAPRATARLLMADQRLPRIAYEVLSLGLLSLFVSAFAINALADRLFPGLMVDTQPVVGSGVLGRLVESFGYVVVTLLTLMVAYQLWIKLLGYKQPLNGVLAATALSGGVMLLLSPLQELLYVAISGLSFDLAIAAMVVNLLLVLGLTSLYFAETLGISVKRSLGLNAVIFLLTLVWLTLAFLVVSFLIWAVGRSLFSVAVGA